MRGILTALALAALLLTTLPFAHAVSKTFTENETYQFGNRTLTIEPFNVNGTGYRENGNLRIWRVGDCQDEGVLQTCLKTASETQATFDETNLAAVLKGTHRTLTTTARAGNTIDGEVTITNDGRITARDVTLTLTVQSPAQFTNGATTFTTQGTLARAGTLRPTYRITRPDNGTTIVTGTVTYHDGNTTKTLALPNATTTFTIPFVISDSFDPVPTLTEKTFGLNLTRSVPNLTIRTTITFPPEAALTNYSRTLSSRNGVLSDTEDFFNNSQRVEYNITYRFTDHPSRALTVTLEYDEAGQKTNTFTKTYPFSVATDGPEPLITLDAKNLTVLEEGSFSVSIVNAVGGRIIISSELVSEVLAGGGPYTLITAPAENGEYPVNITYEWLDSFGRTRSVNGTTLLVVNKPPTASRNPSNATDENATRTENEPTITLIDVEAEREARNVRTLWIAGGAAIGTLAALLLIIRRFRNPVRRVEALLRRTVELRTALVHKRGAPSEEELARLAELEDHLDELKRELE